jgi:maleate isomerase
MDAGVAAMEHLGISRIALLAPYIPATAELVAQFFESSGIAVVSRTTFSLPGDLSMNRVSVPCLIENAQACLAKGGEPQALFISCTALMTSDAVETIETAVGLPVVTSNQALAWDVLRSHLGRRPLDGRGMLFRSIGSVSSPRRGRKLGIGR